MESNEETEITKKDMTEASRKDGKAIELLTYE